MSTAPDQPVADVLLLLPLARTYTYAIPEDLAPAVHPGVQVACPVRARTVAGLVVTVRPRRAVDP
jgi:primosomal protein N'